MMTMAADGQTQADLLQNQSRSAALTIKTNPLTSCFFTLLQKIWVEGQFTYFTTIFLHC